SKTPNEIMGMDVMCKPGQTLREYASVNGTIEVHPDESKEISTMGARIGNILNHELKAGGLCYNTENKIMVTDKCKGLPKIMLPEFKLENFNKVSVHA
ncbi:unnamed protein product, partial [marine sediment metagenome]